MEHLQLEILQMEETKVDIEYLIEHFPGYENPFWYERKVDKEYWQQREIEAREAEERNRKRGNSPFAGTKPDIEIRW
jgi:hypothetical protein